MSVNPGGPSLPTAFVQITLSEVYSEVTGMRQEVRDLASTIRQAVTQVGDHETRIRALERRVWAAGGVVTVLSVGGSGLIAYLMSAR